MTQRDICSYIQTPPVHNQNVGVGWLGCLKDCRRDGAHQRGTKRSSEWPRLAGHGLGASRVLEGRLDGPRASWPTRRL